jgi:hypothetical protein
MLQQIEVGIVDGTTTPHACKKPRSPSRGSAAGGTKDMLVAGLQSPEHPPGVWRSGGIHDACPRLMFKLSIALLHPYFSTSERPAPMIMLGVFSQP